MSGLKSGVGPCDPETASPSAALWNAFTVSKEMSSPVEEFMPGSICVGGVC